MSEPIVSWLVPAYPRGLRSIPPSNPLSRIADELPVPELLEAGGDVRERRRFPPDRRSRPAIPGRVRGSGGVGARPRTSRAGRGDLPSGAPAAAHVEPLLHRGPGRAGARAGEQ